MQLSIIIPTHNRRALLDLTLRYLLAQEQADATIKEIIVVDDHSTDGTEELVRTYQVRTSNLHYLFHARIYHGTFCPARIRNLGAQHSSGTALVFLDCGVLVPPTFAMQVAVHCLESSQ